MKYIAKQYQQFATRHIIEHEGCGLFLEMGLGKTVATMTAIDELMFDRFEVSKVLVIAPKRVAEDTWLNEAAKWDHLRHFRLSLVLGSESQRKAALKAQADIYIINRENVVWLQAFYGTAFPFDMVVIDELSSFKSAKSQRFKSLRMIRPNIKRVVGLTGTPAPNHLLDLWSQLYLLDQGERLGKTLTSYREKYFTAGKRNGHIVYQYNLSKPEKENELLGDGIMEKEIYEKIGDICISMKAIDHLDLPSRVDVTVPIRLTANGRQQYEQFERDQVLALAESGEEISAVNAAALSNKLLQFANGAVYDADKNWHQIHIAKLEALEEIVDVANGKPVLVFYSFRHDAYRIHDHLKAYKPVDLKDSGTIRQWNEGRISLMLAHPASAGHGLNLQAGGNIIVWFGMPWSLELYQQANARLHRQGQTESVIIHHLVTMGTMDEDVMQSLNSKANRQDLLMQAVKARIDKHSQHKTYKHAV
jgi:SNF2 family DNA or RNA helicase